MTTSKLQPFIMPQTPETDLQLIHNEEHNRVEIHLRGPIGGPELLSEHLTNLYHLSEKVSQCLIYINSPGGSVSTLVELLSILKKFDTVITVATGEVASAGFMLWCSGDVRVVQEYCSVMCHRESFGNPDAKTDNHLDMANYTNAVYGAMVRDLCGGVLNEMEMEKIRYAEVFLTSEELIAREYAISWDQFIQADTEEPTPTVSIKIDGDEYVFISESMVMREHPEDPTKAIVLPYIEALYGVPYPAVTIIDTQEG